MTANVVQVSLIVSGKNLEDTAKKLVRAQLINNHQYSVGFDYVTHWFSEKKCISMFMIDVRQASSIKPKIEVDNGE